MSALPPGWDKTYMEERMSDLDLEYVTALEQLRMKIEELKRERDELRRQLDDATWWNHRVRVCANHTAEIVGNGGCVICLLENGGGDEG